MKKTKLLIPFLATAAIAGTIAPLVSCNDKTPETKKGNLMTEYKPTHKRYVQLDEDQFSEPSDVVNTYLSEVSTDPEIFAQDLIYTMSRGLPQYVAYVSDFCEISGQDYNVEIPLDKIVVDGSTITSQIKLTMFYDYSETKPEELLWYDMFAQKWNSETTIELVLDFDTTEEAGFNTDTNRTVQKKQMTILAGAAQFGVSEKNSSIRVLRETGSYTDLEGNVVPLNQTEPYPSQGGLNFILPNWEYWKNVDPSQYESKMIDAYDVWFNMLGAQILVLLFKYYLPSNVLTGTTAPNTLDFGSYYMGDVNLTSDETFKTHEKDSKTTLYGFNPSLDSIRNLDNAVKSGSIVKDEIDQHIIFNVPEANYLASHAFDGNVSAYTNIGVPLGVEEVVIPETYENIESYAFAGNPMTIGLKTLKLNPSAIQNQYCKIHEYAFSELLSLNKIDLSAFPVTFAETVMTDDTLKTIWKNAFADVHLGGLYDDIEGDIILPDGWEDPAYKPYWKEFLITDGLTDLTENRETGFGWYLVPSQNP